MIGIAFQEPCTKQLTAFVKIPNYVLKDNKNLTGISGRASWISPDWGPNDMARLKYGLTGLKVKTGRLAENLQWLV